MAIRKLAITVILATANCVAFGAPPKDGREAVLRIVTQIQRADYEGDRRALERLFIELTPFVQQEAIASRVHYWRGFALWRRALNGFNEEADARDLTDDLERGAAEFRAAAKADPKFVDAKIGAGSCLANLMFLNRSDAPRVKELLAEMRQVLAEAEKEGTENPRLYWVLGPNRWYLPPELGGGQEKAIETYKQGLEAVRKSRGHEATPLDPSWGEPELLMNLAWSNLHRTTPDPKAAESYARSALAMVPCWHYVRDLLMPQIVHAMDVAEIQKLRDKDISASKAGDYETLASLFTEDAVVMAPGSGFVRGRAERDATMAKMREAMSQYEVIEYHEDFEELKILGSDAVEWGTINGQMRYIKTGKVEKSAYKVMRVLRKQPGGDWKIARSIFNDMPSVSP